MCGIAGLVDFSQTTYHLPQVVAAMTHILRHRGPDDEGFLFMGEGQLQPALGNDTPAAVRAATGLPHVSAVAPHGLLGLGHRRLSILDVSAAGHQPMASQDGSLWLVFNGEIYNFVELRAELERLGHAFRTHTDTEVLLAAYRAWGSQMLEKLNGMWALVIYDAARQTLFGARDRFGVKPFYYVHTDRCFAFASQQKALLQLPDLPRQINQKALTEYLVEGVTEREPQGLFEGILELTPGHAFYLNLKNGEFQPWQYYFLNFEPGTGTFHPDRFAHYGARVREHLAEAVRLRLRSDVRLGSCLSGGIDSSALVCLIDRQMQASPQPQVGLRQNVFTASYANSPLDESPWARQVVEQTQTAWHQVYPQPEEMLQDLEDLVYAQDIPFFSSSTYAQYCVMQLVNQQGVRVTLDGQGADELFSGYSRHFPVFMAELLLKKSLGEFKRNLQAADNSFADRRRLLPEGAKLLLSRWLSAERKQALLFRNRPELGYLQPELREQALHNPNARPADPLSLNALLHRQLTGPDLKVLLRTGDRNSMRFSVESRMPFADHHPLIEFVTSIPSIYKVRPGQGKALLREAMHGILPEPVRQRKDKVGFATPEPAWLLQLKEPLREYLTDDLQDYLDVRRLRQDWNKLIANSATHGSAYVWRLLNFAVWKQVFGM